MTTWVEIPREGRDRGVAGILRAWVAVLVNPREFFRTGVAPGDQAPGLLFAISVTLVYQALQYALAPASIPSTGTGPLLSALLALLVIALFVAPAVLHLTAAIQTVLLLPVVSKRAGVSETVQVIAYSAAPCALAGIPVPGVRLLCALYGSVLLVVGIREVHQTTFAKAALAAAIPAGIVFGYGFGGFRAFNQFLTALS